MIKKFDKNMEVLFKPLKIATGRKEGYDRGNYTTERKGPGMFPNINSDHID